MNPTITTTDMLTLQRVEAKSLEKATGEARRSPTCLASKYGLLGPSYYEHIASAVAMRRRRRQSVMADWAKGLVTGVEWGPGGHRWMSSPRGALKHVSYGFARETFARWSEEAFDAARRLDAAEDALMTDAERKVCTLLVAAPNGEEYKRILSSNFDTIGRADRRAPEWLALR